MASNFLQKRSRILQSPKARFILLNQKRIRIILNTQLSHLRRDNLCLKVNTLRSQKLAVVADVTLSAETTFMVRALEVVEVATTLQVVEAE